MSFALTYVVRSLGSALASAVFLTTFAVVRAVAPARAPRYLRWFLQRRGGGFAKLGQILAMRFDLLPPAYYDELRAILDRMPPVAVRTIRRTIERDLGRPIAAVFASFDDAPLASASIAQAHRAVLPGGERVVVKVMRPRIAAVLRADLVNLELISWLLQAVGLFRTRDLGRIVREIKRYTLEELDFRREAFNAQALHDAMAADAIDHYSPRPYFEACGAQVIVLEELTGVWLADLIGAIQRDDRALLARWAADGITPHRVARVLHRSTLEQAYRHRVFHGDPHAGNVVVLPGGTLGYIDFGIVGELDEDLAVKQERLVFHLVAGELRAAYRMLLASIELEEHRDLAEFELAVTSEFSSYLRRVRSRHATPAEKSVGRVFLAVANAIRVLDLRLPAKLTRFYRAQLIVDMLVFKLHPALDPAAEFEQFWHDETRRRLHERVAGVSLTGAGAALSALPRAARELTDFLQFQVPRITTSYGESISRLERGIVLGLDYLRRGVLAGALGVIVLHWWPSRLDFVTAVPSIDQYWILWTAGLAAVGHGLGRIARRMRTFD
ncbi:MAG TPA: AarF/UbiB family protein [Kofleriaceae bacterium]|nr:AarF/UbiB family protein [Kofleriaceae bacterium]